MMRPNPEQRGFLLLELCVSLLVLGLLVHSLNSMVWLYTQMVNLERAQGDVYAPWIVVKPHE